MEIKVPTLLVRFKKAEGAEMGQIVDISQLEEKGIAMFTEIVSESEIVNTLIDSYGVGVLKDIDALEEEIRYYFEEMVLVEKNQILVKRADGWDYYDDTTEHEKES